MVWHYVHFMLRLATSVGLLHRVDGDLSAEGVLRNSLPRKWSSASRMIGNSMMPQLCSPCSPHWWIATLISLHCEPCLKCSEGADGDGAKSFKVGGGLGDAHGAG